MLTQSPQDDESGGNLATLTEEVAQLRDLFHRRLFDDKAKGRLYEELYDQVTLARGAMADQILLPVVRDIILVIDRVQTIARDGDVVLESIVDELLEVIERCDVRPVHRTVDFDPALHEAVGTAVADGVSEGSIVRVARRGYRYGDRLLRPEQVVVAALRLGDVESQERESSSSDSALGIDFEPADPAAEAPQ